MSNEKFIFLANDEIEVKYALEEDKPLHDLLS
jgi:hypothetical protein